MAPPRLATWAREWTACRRCHRTVYPHAARGLCKNCYTAGVVKTWRERQRGKREFPAANRRARGRTKP